MKKRFRLIPFFLAFLLLLSACNTKGGKPAETEGGGEEFRLPIVENGSSEYVIVTPVTMGSELESAVSDFKKVIKSKTGAAVRMVNDFVKESEGDSGVKKEILIGATNRAASVSARAELKCNDYVVTNHGNQLVIVGGSENATVQALKRFEEACFSADTGGNLVLTKDSFFELKNTYAIDSFTVNGVALSDYRIVYPKDSVYLKDAAETLWSAIATNTGYDVEMTDDGKPNNDGKRELLIGNTSHSSEAKVQGENRVQYLISGGNIQIIGSCVNDTVRGVDAFIAENLSKTGTVALTVENGQLTELSQDASYKVMSFNILYNDRENRADLISEAIHEALPDSIGFQEDSTNWIALLEPRLKDVYNWVGTDVTDLSDTYHNAIFYRKDRFECLETDTYWLSNSPTLSYSKFETSKYCRIVTYAVLKDKQSGGIYVHFNTHLDIDRDAAVKQLEVLQEITSKCEYPYVVTGDFNINSTWKEYGFMQKTWLDARKVAEKTTEDWTDISGAIDYCMLSSDVIASEFSVLNSPYILKQHYESGDLRGQSYYLSDHYPVCVTFNLKSK